VEISLLDDGQTLHVSVVDSGAGVPESLRADIFTEGVSTKDDDGHGLGLALARQAAAALGGRIWLADSETGAVFVAELPNILKKKSEVG
jgi:two-component system CitB family sensor kinase